MDKLWKLATLVLKFHILLMEERKRARDAVIMQIIFYTILFSIDTLCLFRAYSQCDISRSIVIPISSYMFVGLLQNLFYSDNEDFSYYLVMLTWVKILSTIIDH